MNGLGLHHWNRRRKQARQALDWLIYPAAVASPLALVPQVWQLYATHDVSSLSLPTWATLGVINIIWIIYGLVHREGPVLLTNAALMILNFSIALGVLLYR